MRHNLVVIFQLKNCRSVICHSVSAQAATQIEIHFISTLCDILRDIVISSPTQSHAVIIPLVTFHVLYVVSMITPCNIFFSYWNSLATIFGWSVLLGQYSLNNTFDDYIGCPVCCWPHKSKEIYLKLQSYSWSFSAAIWPVLNQYNPVWCG